MIVHTTDFKTNMGKYLDRLREEDLIILRNGKPVGRVVAYTEITNNDLIQENGNAYEYRPYDVAYEEFIEQYSHSEERIEYIDGKVYNLSAPSVSHQKIIRELSNILYHYFKDKSCQFFTSPFDVHFDKLENKACVQPDLLVICDEENIGDDDKYYGIPSMIIEVMSPSSKSKDSIIKLNLYWQQGVKEYLLVDPRKKEIHYWYFDKKEIVIHTIIKLEERFRSCIFKDLFFDVKSIF